MPIVSVPGVSASAKFFPLMNAKASTLPSGSVSNSTPGARLSWAKLQSDAFSAQTSSKEGGSQLIPRAAWTKPQIDTSSFTGQAPSHRISWIRTEQNPSAPDTPPSKTWVKTSGNAATAISPFKALPIFISATPTSNFRGVNYIPPVAGDASSGGEATWIRPQQNDSTDDDAPNADADDDAAESDTPRNERKDSASPPAGALPTVEADEKPSSILSRNSNEDGSRASTPLTIITKEAEAENEESKECDSPKHEKTTTPAAGLKDVDVKAKAKAAPKKKGAKKGQKRKAPPPVKKPPPQVCCCSTM